MSALPSLPFRNSNLLAFNAGALSLLTIAAKPSPLDDAYAVNEIVLLLQTVSICAALGAFMPSIASSFDLTNQLGSNVAGVTLLVLTTNFILFLQKFYVLDGTTGEHGLPWPVIQAYDARYKSQSCRETG
ncbi:hypothetical protein GOP47_0002453 [Adiantum capillus-veneris]|uniref:Uncharacterized protein n=1 Tax=Adiantum capillus-veneris TaxID=13818 RepID=A0A9D4VA49_ADICA|nr:hypothetical protein GOP47_0002453 [Adiantum capillus-veneris]